MAHCQGKAVHAEALAEVVESATWSRGYAVSIRVLFCAVMKKSLFFFADCTFICIFAAY
jgi:hypothetical protein